MSEKQKGMDENLSGQQSPSKISVSEKQLEIPDDGENASYNSDSSDDSDFSTLTGLSELSGQEWKPMTRPLNWVQKQIHSGANPREILSQILSTGTVISSSMNDMSLWRILATMLTEPPRRQKLRHVNTITDVVQLLKSSENIIVLTGAGVSVSCGIPDFRSNDGIYSRLAKDFPGLPDPQAMFDINYFAKDPRPFYKFAREIYPGQFKPSPCHRFIKMLEKKGKLLRNYTQNIDTLEQVAGIEKVIECHGSFASATCTKCDYKTTSDEIRNDIFEQTIPLCPKCQLEQPQKKSTDDSEEDYSELVRNGIMKPDIVFFGEGLPDVFHSAMAHDKDKCDLLIVIGSSLKVHPVALIPRSVPADVPQILINREQLCHLEFDVELLGDSDTIINQLCHLLGGDWKEICWNPNVLTESRLLKPKPFEKDEQSNSLASAADTDSQSTKSAITNSSSGRFCDSGFESSSSSNIPQHSRCYTKQSIPKQSSDSTDSDIENDNQTYQLEDFQQKMTEKVNLRHLSVDSSKDSGVGETSNSSSSSSSCSISSRSSNRREDIICDDNSTSQDLIKKKSSENNSPDTDGGCNNEPYLWIQKPDTVTQNITDRLCENTYYRHSSSGIYIFPGAQIYWRYSDSESESSDDTDADDYVVGIENDLTSNTHIQINQNNDEDDDSPPIKRRRNFTSSTIDSSTV